MEEKKMFNRTVNLEKDKIIIKITCNERSHIKEPKVIFKENVEDSIPVELRQKVKLFSKPEKILSNMRIPGHAQECVWVYQVVKDTKPETRKNTTRRRRTRAVKKSS